VCVFGAFIKHILWQGSDQFHYLKINVLPRNRLQYCSTKQLR